MPYRSAMPSIALLRSSLSEGSLSAMRRTDLIQIKSKKGEGPTQRAGVNDMLRGCHTCGRRYITRWSVGHAPHGHPTLAGYLLDGSADLQTYARHRRRKGSGRGFEIAFLGRRQPRLGNSRHHHHLIETRELEGRTHRHRIIEGEIEWQILYLPAQHGKRHARTRHRAREDINGVFGFRLECACRRGADSALEHRPLTLDNLPYHHARWRAGALDRAHPILGLLNAASHRLREIRIRLGEL